MGDALSALSAIEQRLDGNTARGLAAAVSAAVRDGVLSGGQVLPPIRTIAHQLALSPTTVSAAWRTLTRAGVIHTDGRRGTVVAYPTRPRPDRYGRVTGGGGTVSLDLSTGVPDVRLLPDPSHGLARLSGAGVPRSYLDDPVLPELAVELRRRWPYDAAHLTVVDGAMDGLALVLRTTVRFGDRVAVEHPTFPPIVDLLESIGAAVVGVRMDGEGLRLDELSTAVSQGISCVVLQPRAQNPTGVCLSRERAAAIAAMALEHDLLIVEDDSMGEVSSGEPVSVGAFAPEQVVHLHSFSKSHGPDLRIAALSAPTQLMGELLARRQLGQGWTSRLLQRLLLDLLTRPESVRSVQSARRTYAARRARMTDLLAAHGVSLTSGDGINLWVPVADETAALVRLGAAGIGAAPGTPFQVCADPQHYIRVTSGLVDDVDAERVAVEIAAAAGATGWSARQR